MVNEDWTDEEIDNAIQTPIGDMFDIGLELEYVILSAKGSNDPSYHDDAVTTFGALVRFVETPEHMQDRESMRNFGRMLHKLNEEASRNADAESVIRIKKILETMTRERDEQSTTERKRKVHGTH